MQPSDVMAYGCDYSAREFTPREMDQYPGVRIDWLARYIGYPGNPKCISYYPGAYRRHRDSGRPVVLFHQIEYRDFEGGYEKGRGHAQTALADAKRQGWDGETPILACFDRRMPAFTRGNITYRAIWIDEVRDYVRGFKSVLGYEDSGFYGFEDTMGPCVRENWVRFRMQCGGRSAHIQGITSWQENNVQPLLLGTQTDRLELYIPLAELAGRQQKRVEHMILVKGPGDEIYAVGAGGKRHVKSGREARAHLEAGVKQFEGFTQAELDAIPDDGAAALWNFQIPTEDSDSPSTYRPAHRVVAGIYESVADVIADVDEAALAAELKKQGVNLGGATPAEVKSAMVAALNSTKLTVTT